MPMDMERQPVSEILHDSANCRFAIQRLGANVVLLRISGTDVGEFGRKPLSELDTLVSGDKPVALFIDARNALGASLDVSSEWARWLQSKRNQLAKVHMVTGSRFVHLTANFVRRYADLESLMIVYTDAGEFDAALSAAMASAK